MKKILALTIAICITSLLTAQIKSNSETLLNSLHVKKVVVKFSKASYSKDNPKQEIYPPIQVLEQEIVNGYPTKTTNYHNTNGLLKDKTNIKYDSAHREVEIVSVNAGTINEHNTGIEDVQKYSYDKEGNVTSASREYGGNNSYATYSYKYNEKKQIIEKTTIEGRANYTVHFTYNKNGDLVKINDGTKKDRGTWFDYEYYKSGKLKQKSKNTIEHTWQYDENGNLTAELEPGKSFYYKYDDKGRIMEYTESQQSGTFVTTIQFKYDSNDNLISEAILDGKLANGGYKYYTEKLKAYSYHDNKLLKEIIVYRERKLEEEKKYIFEKYFYEYSF